MANVTFERLAIAGLVMIVPRRFGDERGYFMETYSARDFAALGIGATFVQDNQSLSAQPGTVRGLHFQIPPEPQAKLVRVLRGSIFDVAVDLRRGSSSYGRWCSATSDCRRGRATLHPAGLRARVLHA